MLSLPCRAAAMRGVLPEMMILVRFGSGWPSFIQVMTCRFCPESLSPSSVSTMHSIRAYRPISTTCSAGIISVKLIEIYLLTEIFHLYEIHLLAVLQSTVFMDYTSHYITLENILRSDQTYLLLTLSLKVGNGIQNIS